MKEVLFILTRPFIPSHGGGEKMLLQAIEFIPNEYKVHVFYFSSNSIADNTNFEVKLKENYPTIKEIKALKFPSFIEIFANILLRRTSLNESFFYSRSSLAVILKLIYSSNFECVYCDMLRTAQYVENIDLPKVVDLDDLLSKRYMRLLNYKTSNLSLFGTFSNRNNFFFNLISNFFVRPVLFVEHYLIKKREILIASKFDRVAIVSPVDALQLSNYIGKHVFALPPARAFKMDGFHKSDFYHSDEFRFLFVGNLTTNQNFSSIEMIITKLLPKIRAFNVSFTFNVVGVYDSRLHYLKDIPDVNLIGYCEDLRSVYESNDILLAPLSFGTGIKLKIIDAIEYGLPVVTNSVGAEGLPIFDMENAVVSDDFDDMAAKINQIILNRQFLTDFRKNAIASLSKSFTTQIVKKKFVSFLSGL
ncbi:glycosyltransferase family 4 protein [Neptuniibacter pectenicola]|uniref:glycosyltransferase family 4 protein n=1 Tax=Neptuniibacter pectenicola TaxID=1806669 RepID=UPI00082F5214|nr:glycosyltransferase family 4 protein [Neptuniibacter pectenicola]